MAQYSCNIPPNRIARIVRPGRIHTEIWHLYPTVDELAELLLLPLDANIRDHPDEIAGDKVGKGIGTSIDDAELRTIMDIINRGLTVLSPRATYNQQRQRFTIDIDDEETEGVIDGGTTLTVLKQKVREGKLTIADLQECSIHIEVLCGINNLEFENHPNPARLVSKFHNINKPIQKESEIDLDGGFEWIKEVVEASEYKGRVGYTETSIEPVNVKLVLRCLNCFLEPFADGRVQPTKAYDKIKSILKEYENVEKDMRPKYEKLSHILISILECRDFIESHIEEWYLEANPNGKLGSRTGFNDTGKKTIQAWTGNKIDRMVPDGIVIPILASLRILVNYNGRKARWTQDPKEFLLENGPAIVLEAVDRLTKKGNIKSFAQDGDVYKALWQEARCHVQ